jgi:hypothetical protein
MPGITDKNEAVKIITRQHPEYLEYVETSRWILDTLESGDTYRHATYGSDLRGKPVRNLLRHKREYPDPPHYLRDEFGAPIDVVRPEDADFWKIVEYDYDLRIKRTPVPRFLSTVIEKQLSKIYKRPIREEGPDDLMAWLDNIDGRETTLQEWMKQEIGPLLSALGMIDVQFGHPARDDDEPALFGDDLSDADKRCVASYILPENLPWWRPDYTGRYYVEALVKERHDVDGRERVRYRHWTHLEWALYENDGELVEWSYHNYQIVPIVRLIDRRDLRRAQTANSRMWGIADKSRAYYNEESELIANNTLHNVPLLQGPGDDAPDGGRDTAPIGRYYLLHKVVDRNGAHVGYDYVSPPTDPSQFMRLRLFDLVERIEQEAALTRTVGSVGTDASAGPVAQSGISKAYDQVEGSEYLSGVAAMLESNHYAIMYFALIVLRDGYDRAKPDIDRLLVIYPKEFNLLSFDQFAAIVAAEQLYLGGGLGMIPTAEKMTIRQFVRFRFPDASQEELKAIDAEIDILVNDKVKSRKDATRAPAPPAITGPTPVQPPPPNPSPLSATGRDGKIPQGAISGTKTLKA